VADVARRVLALRSEQLLALVGGERWLATAREPVAARVSGVVPVNAALALAFVELRLPEGTHETYALALAPAPEGELRDALGEPEHAAALAALAGVDVAGAGARPIGVEQTNSSVVLDGHVLKLYRRLEAGPNPELEMLRALARLGFANAPPLLGAFEYEGDPIDTTLLLVTGLVPAVGDGWELAIETLVSEPSWLPDRARRLGEVTGAMHAALAGGRDDPVFAPEEPSTGAASLLAASIDDEIARLFVDLPDDDALDPIRHAGEGLRDLAQSLGRTGSPGLVIRVHGDYHLGQVLWSERGDWIVIDFEGEPGRSLPERRQRQTPLRDVAGMLRSFAYAALAVEREGAGTAPPGWEARCRGEFLAGYHATVDERLLPPSEAGAERLLALLELQKLVYELRYEMAHRPAWVSIPVDGLTRMLAGA
jgi:predicted trehalose synthase